MCTPQIPTTHLNFINNYWYYFTFIYSFTYSSPALAAALFWSTPVENFVLLSTKLVLQKKQFSAQNALKLTYRHLGFQNKIFRRWHPGPPFRREREGEDRGGERKGRLPIATPGLNPGYTYMSSRSWDIVHGSMMRKAVDWQSENMTSSSTRVENA